MQAHKNKIGATHSRPAMRMWEWFDMWALYEEVTRRFGSSNLFEGKDEDENPYSEEEKAKQHDHYLKHFREVLHNHNTMTPEESKKRLQHVGAWAAETGAANRHAGDRGRPAPALGPSKGEEEVSRHPDEEVKDWERRRKNPKEQEKAYAKRKEEHERKHGKRSAEHASGLRGDGHDLKSAHSVGKIVRSVSDSKHGHILLKAAKSLAGDPHKSPERGKGVAGRTSPEEDKAYVAATLMTGHGEAQSAPENEETRRLHSRLHARRAHAETEAGARKSDESEEKYEARVNAAEGKIPPNHKHGYASIANDTNHTEDQAKSHRSRIFGKRAGKSGSSPIRTLAMQAISHAESGGSLDHKWVAKSAKELAIMRRRSMEGKGTKSDKLKGAVSRGQALGGTDDEAKGMEGISQSSSKRAQMVKRGEQSSPKWHHPSSKQAKAGHPSMTAVPHEAVNKALGHKKTATIDITSAAKKLKDKGHTTGQIADLLKHPHAEVMRMVHGFSPTGIESGTGASGRRKGSREKRDQEPVAKAMRSEKEAKLAKSKTPTEAVKADLHRLYPLRDKVGEGDDEEGEDHSATFHKRVKKMYKSAPHQKDIQKRAGGAVAKDAPESEIPERMGLHGVPSAGRAGFGGGKVKGLMSPLDHPGDFDKTASLKKHGGDEKKVAADQKNHQAKLDAFHDNLAEKHAGVHAAMDHVLANVRDRNHPLTVQHREHHDAIKLAKDTKNNEELAKLEKEGKKKNIMGDIIAHHLNRSADDENVQKALGVSRARARAALTNIMGRLEKHGEHSMAANIARGGAQQKSRAGGERGSDKKRAGDPLSRARVRVPGDESGAGGDIESPTKHKPERFIEPAKPTKKVKLYRAGDKPVASPLSKLDKSAALADARAGRKPPVARGKSVGTATVPVPSLATRALDLRAQAARSAGGATRVAKQQVAQGRNIAQHRAQVKSPSGAGGPIGPYVSSAAKKAKARIAARQDAAEAARKSLAGKVAAAPADKKGPAVDPAAGFPKKSGLERVIASTVPSRSGGRAKITKTTSPTRGQKQEPPQPGTPGGRKPAGVASSDLIRERPTGEKGVVYQQHAAGGRSAPGVRVRPKKKDEPWERKVGDVFGAPRSPVTPPKASAPSGEPYTRTGQSQIRTSGGAKKSEGAKKLDAIFKKPENKEESLFLRTRLVVNETASFPNRVSVFA